MHVHRPLIVTPHGIEDLGNVVKPNAVHGETEVAFVVIGQVALVEVPVHGVQFRAVELGNPTEIPSAEAGLEGVVRKGKPSQDTSVVIDDEHIRIHKVGEVAVQDGCHGGNHGRVTKVVGCDIGAIVPGACPEPAVVRPGGAHVAFVMKNEEFPALPGIPGVLGALDFAGFLIKVRSEGRHFVVHCIREFIQNLARIVRGCIVDDHDFEVRVVLKIDRIQAGPEIL